MVDTPAGQRWTRWLTLLRFAAVAFVVGLFAARWSPETGFSSVIRFGKDFEHRRLPELSTLPIAVVEGAGYDGQFYAQLAINPDLSSAEVRRALDLPSYRARRIALPLVAHVAGGGGAWRTLQIYALLNVVAWLVLAWCWWRWLPSHEVRATCVWLAGVLSLGVLDSVRFALTDLPMLLGLLFAVRALTTRKLPLAIVALAVAGFVRETAVLAVSLLIRGRQSGRRIWRWLQVALCVAPVAWWSWSLMAMAPDSGTGMTGNFDWPGFALARHLVTCGRELLRGNFDSRYVFGLIGGVNLGYQSLFLLRRWRSAREDAWLRLGLPFAVLFWFLGDYVWHGYWAVARSVLPMTFVFLRALVGERRFVVPLIAGNVYLLHGLYRFLP